MSVRTKKIYRHFIVVGLLWAGVCRAQGQTDPASAPDRPLEGRAARAALSILIEGDSTGNRAALVAGALSEADKLPWHKSTQTVVDEATKLATDLRQAATPRALQALAEAEAGRRLGLRNAMAGFDPHALAYPVAAVFEEERTVSRLLLESRSRYNTRDVAKVLLDEGKLPISDKQLSQLLGAVAGLPSGQTIDSFVNSVADDATKKSVRSVLQIMADPRKFGERELEQASTALVTATVAKLDRRAGEVLAGIQTVNTAYNVITSVPYQQMWKGNVSADTLIGSARALSTVAGLIAPELARQIDTGVRTVQAGMEIYKGAALLAAGATGGTFIAAMAIINGAGMLKGIAGGGGQDQTQALMKAIAQLARMISQEFARINGRLDSIEATLGRIERDLNDLRRISDTTLTQVMQTRREVVGLYDRISLTETNLLTSIVRTAASDCLTYVTYTQVQQISEQELRKCLGAFSNIATTKLPIVHLPDGQESDALIANFSAEAAIQASRRSSAAWILARRAGAIHGDGELLAAADEERRTSDIASARLSVEGANAIYAALRRHGRGRIDSSDLNEYVQNNDLGRIVSRLEAVEAFRRKLAGSDQAQIDRLNRPVEMYSAAQSSFIAAVKAERVAAIKKYVVEPERGIAKPAFSGELRRCSGGAPLPSIGAGSIAQTRLGNIVLGTGGSYRLQDSSSTAPVLRGLSVCLVDLSIDQSARPKTPGFDHFLGSSGGGFSVPAIPAHLEIRSGRAIFRVSFFGVTLPDQTASLAKDVIWNRTSLMTEAEALSRMSGQLHSQLATFLNDERNRATVEDAMARGLDESPATAIQLRNLAALYRANAELADVALRLKAASAGMDEALALLRGHIALAYPATYAANRTLRGMLEGNAATRIPDKDAYFALATCATLIMSDASSAQRIDGGKAPPTELVDKTCSGLAKPEWLSAAALQGVRSRFVNEDVRLKKAISDTNWKLEDEFPEGSASGAAARIRAFITEGGSPSFYD